MEKRIYLDHAATTYTKQEVLEEMLPFFTEQYGNPSSVHAFGREARKALDLARERTAKALNADPGSIYFTGSGTEADNWAIKGAAFANQKKAIILLPPPLNIMLYCTLVNTWREMVLKLHTFRLISMAYWILNR